ncbi:MAG TPA: MarC family protein [Stellaceae bacterium]|nr:MarC family protein [Stellaceae bacterium]
MHDLFALPGAFSDAANTFLLIYAGLFPIVNPVGSAPIFLAMTRHFTLQQRHKAVGWIALNGFLLLLGSLFVGSHVLEFFGITLPVVRIAGGLVVTSFGWTLLQAGVRDDDHDAAQRAATPADSFYPLTMPLTVGPGSISVAITLGSQRPPEPENIAHLALLGIAAVLGLIAISLSIYLCYRFAERLTETLGESGTNVLVRLSAFILLCIGIEIVWTGVSALLGIHAGG